MQAAVDTTPLYASLLVVHVLAALLGALQVVVAVRESTAVAKLGHADQLTEVQRRYLTTPSAFFARILYLVPVTGAALIGASSGSVRVTDPWVLIGIALWLTAIGHLEFGLLASEVTMRRHVNDDWTAVTRAARRASAMGKALGGILGLAAVVMVLQPG